MRSHEELHRPYTASVVPMPERAGLTGVPARIWVQATSEQMKRMLLTTTQLGVLLLAMHAFQLEKASGILKLTPLIFGGFLVHAALP
ncbi:MAG: hypothetical protein H0T48_00720, partial [Gemmatimonadaceae bacterium]|nr:hypothetical protein [Gemmatimonadaceae bacterium]